MNRYLPMSYDRLSAEAFALKQDYAKAHAYMTQGISYGYPWNAIIKWDTCNQMAANMARETWHRLTDHTPEQISQIPLQGFDVHNRGMAYLLKARRLRKEDRSPMEILETLELSIKELRESGHQLQLAKTRFELADSGTLFLDEIGNIPMDIQVHLLRALQTREFQRVGGIKTIRSDFRLITATNRDLSREVEAGRFREDLYYRINVFPVNVPPLRERREDIPVLALYFLRRNSARMGKSFENIPKREIDKLLKYPWPGNVRELQNVIERGLILSSGSQFKVPQLTGNRTPAPEPEEMTLAENERRHILRVLEKTGGKIRGKDGAAESLGVPYSTLYYRMKKFGIKPAHSQES